MKRVLALLLLLASYGAHAQTVTASATLTWTAVTTSTTGGTITGVTYSAFGDTVAAGGTCSTTGLTQLTTGLTGLTYTSTQSGLTPGSQLCFAVKATAAGVTGAFSNVVGITVPSPPTPGAPGQVTVTVVFVSSP